MVISDIQEKVSFVHLLLKLNTQYQFLKSFFTFDRKLENFIKFCEIIDTQLIKKGNESELLKALKNVGLTKANVISHGEKKFETKKPKTRTGGGGNTTPPPKGTISSMLEDLKEEYKISDEEAIIIREICEEKLHDKSITTIIDNNQDDEDYLRVYFSEELRASIVKSYEIRKLDDRIMEPIYDDKGAILDTMTGTIISQELFNIGKLRYEQGNIKVDVKFEDESIWLTQSQICELYGKAKSTISEHVKAIFEDEELDEKVVVRNFRTTTKHGAIEGKTQTKDVKYYNLDMIIALGFRVRSNTGTKFRIWANQKLKEYITKGFVLDDDRFKSGTQMSYFDELQKRLRDIRISERFFYQKIKDIYMTSIDYDPKDEKTVEFFKIVQNKLLWAISCQTAAELVHNRVDINKPLLGMNSFDKDNKNITKKDVSVAKNYLNEEEIKLLGLLVEQYLAFAETMASQKTPMYMKDWIQRLDMILTLNGRELLNHSGKISHTLAKNKSELEYEKFKENQKVLEKSISLKELEEDIKKLK
jgi:hypothetical protein